MLDTVTFSEISPALGIIGVIATLVIFAWSQRRSIENIKTTVDAIQIGSRDFHAHVETALTKYDMTLSALVKDNDTQSAALSKLLTSHGATQVTLDFMTKIFDRMSNTMSEVTNSVSKLSNVIDNQAKTTEELIVILKTSKFNN